MLNTAGFQEIATDSSVGLPRNVTSCQTLRGSSLTAETSPSLRGSLMRSTDNKSSTFWSASLKWVILLLNVFAVCTVLLVILVIGKDTLNATVGRMHTRLCAL